MQPEMIPLTLIDRAALEHLKSKDLAGSFSHYDIWLDQHQYAFTVAKMMDADMLAEVRSAIADALENGTGFTDFQKRLKPYLMARGWWGEAVMGDPVDGVVKKVQLGSTRRLRTIFETNMTTAHAASRWQRIERNAKAMPYLRYNGSAAHHKRKDHQKYYGLILPVQHPIWQQIYPPNGYGCKCTVTQLTRGQAEREGISDEPEFEFVQVTNPRTGKVVSVPKDITPSFAHNHAKRTDTVLDVAAERHGKKFADDLASQSHDYLWQRINTSRLNIFDFSDIKTDESRINELSGEGSGAKIKRHEAVAAAQWEVAFGTKLQRFEMPPAQSGKETPDNPDFWIVGESDDKDTWQKLEFLGTFDPNTGNIIEFNRTYTKSSTAWKRRKEGIVGHIDKADFLGLDLRHFYPHIRIKIIAFVLSLPQEKRNKVVFII